MKLFSLTTLLFILTILPAIDGARVEAAELRVMSFNIRYGTAKDGENHWDKRKEFVVETINAMKPDLLGTQETVDFQKAFLDENLSGYASIGAGRDDGKTKGEMTTIHYKTDRFELVDEGHFWLSETPDVPGSKSWDTSLPRICSWVKLLDRSSDSKRPILFMNTHFDHRGPQARLESAGLLRSKANELGKDCDIVLTGDFNSGVDSEPYKRLFGASDSSIAFKDTFAATNSSAIKNTGTFSGFQSSQIDGARIDWIATSGKWQILNAGIDRTERDGRTPSDHFPVYAVIEQTVTD